MINGGYWYFNNYKPRIWPSALGIYFAVTEVLLFTEAWEKIFTNNVSQYTQGFIPFGIGLLIETILLFLISAYPLYKRYFKSYPIAAKFTDGQMLIKYSRGAVLTKSVQEIGKVDFKTGKSFFFFTKTPKFLFYDKQGKVFLQAAITDAQEYEEIIAKLRENGLGVGNVAKAEKTDADVLIDSPQTNVPAKTTNEGSHHVRDIMIGIVGGASFLYAYECSVVINKLLGIEIELNNITSVIVVLEGLIGWLTAYFTKGQVKRALYSGITVIAIFSIAGTIYAALTAKVLIWGLAIMVIILYGSYILMFYAGWTCFWGWRRRRKLAINEVLKASNKSK